MTLEEAKEFYFQYYGFSFHMDREEPARYNSFINRLILLGLEGTGILNRLLGLGTGLRGVNFTEK